MQPSPDMVEPVYTKVKYSNESMDVIKWKIKPVESTNLVSVAYSSTAQMLRIEFKHNKVYYYLNVPKNIHMNLMRAKSKGQFFNKHINNKFMFLKEE